MNDTVAFHIERLTDQELKIGFGRAANNDDIVKDTSDQLADLLNTGKLSGGELLKINGPASVPAAMVIAHAVGHLYQAVACFDPKIRCYVVVIAHGSRYELGQLVIPPL